MYFNSPTLHPNLLLYTVPKTHSGPKIFFKKVQAKKLVKSNKSFFPREIVFLAVLKHFLSSKTDYWPYLKLQKMEFGQKIFREIDLGI